MTKTMSQAAGGVLRVLFFGTHPKQFNGYSKVVYELCKEIGKMEDRVTFMVHGFQNFHDTPGHRADVPGNVVIYDAFANENPRQAGFGVAQARQHVALARPDVVVLYNDLVVITSLLEELRQVPERGRFKIIAYIDQVYLNQKKEHIQFVNQHADAAIMFTDFWKDCILDQGLSLPSHVLTHAFNRNAYFPIPKNLARRFFGLPEEDFIILNLNRNQPRKRWDTCLKAFAELLLRTRPQWSTGARPKPRLVIATEMTGGWNLGDILERELQRRGLDAQEGLSHVSRIDAPQRMTDEDTNFLYNVADIGINTCDGEGFGLCNFEQAAIGIPQVVPRLGGFLTFFDDDCAVLVEPKISYYVDASRDAIGGEALMCDSADFTTGMLKYYNDAVLCKRHGEAARQKLTSQYQWNAVACHLLDICEQVHRGSVAAEKDATQTKIEAPVNTETPATPMTTTETPGTPSTAGSVLIKKDDEIKLLRQRLKELLAFEEGEEEAFKKQ
jgi:glycosyltransferase involved in cell wall biosynthesis